MLILKNLVFTLIMPGTVAVYVPLHLGQGREIAPGLLMILAVAMLLSGLAIYTWCVWDFAAFGRGTPVPFDAPARLVVRGLYRYSRNPMYVGVLVVISGWALLFAAATTAVYGLVVAICFHLMVVLYEERRLQQQFGQQYEAYRARVGRWY